MESTELYHYGVKGMKWGVRRARQEYRKLDTAKGQYKHAKKAYDRSFNYANSQTTGYRLSTVKRAENDAAWNDARRDAKRVAETKTAYKAQKKAVRENAPVVAKLERGGKHVAKGLGVVGGMYLYDQIYLGGAGSKLAKSATTKAFNAVKDKAFPYELLDASGKVIRRYR